MQLPLCRKYRISFLAKHVSKHMNVIYKPFVHVCKCDEAGNQPSAHVSSLAGIEN